MKPKNIKGLVTLSRLSGALTLVAALAAAAPARAANSPVGTWDFVLSGGGEKGLAIITFGQTIIISSNSPVVTSNWFSGYELIATQPPAAGTDPYEADASRNGGAADLSRNGFVPSTTPPSGDNVVGFGPVQGPWSFDAKGRVVGFFGEVVGVGSVSTNYYDCISGRFVSTNATVDGTNYSFDAIISLGCFTNPVPYTNVTVSWTIPAVYSATFTIPVTNSFVAATSSQQTNGVSFVAKVSGNRLTMTASTDHGKITYRGKKVDPTSTLVNLTGNWQAVDQHDQQDFLEFFTLNPTLGTQAPFPAYPSLDLTTNFGNIYFTTDGVGPTYSFIGVSMISIQRRIGFTMPTDTLRSTVGSVSSNARQIKANTKGIALPATDVVYKASLPH